MCIAMQNYIYNFPNPQMQIYIPQKNINAMLSVEIRGDQLKY